MSDVAGAPAGSRLARVPIDFVVSEVAAYPLASVESLRHPIEALDPGEGSWASGPTARLWRAAEHDLLRSLPAVSIDEIVQIRDDVWFARHPAGPVPLHHHLRSSAARFVEPPDLSHTPDLAPGPVWRRRRLWTALSLPSDLLSAAGGEIDKRVLQLSPPLTRCLRDAGFAETHLHVGAAMDFGLLWGLIVLHAGDADFESDLFAGPGADLDEGRDLARWLLPALVARVVLARHVAAGSERLSDTVRDLVVPDVVGRLGACAEAALRDSLACLLLGRPSSTRDFARVRALYRDLCRTGRGARTIDDVHEQDPVAELVGWSRGAGTPEGNLLARSLAALDRIPQAEDPNLHRLFWQTVRVRNLVYRHITHRPMVPGLQWFVRFYGRLAKAKRGAAFPLLLDSAARTCGEGQGLRSLEVRTAPASTVEQQVEDIRAVARFAAVKTGLEVGLVLHFIKDRGGGAKEGTPLGNWRNSNPDPSAHFDAAGIRNRGYRYGTYYRRLREQAVVLATSIQRWPRLLYVLRGVDACTDELGVPAWVLRPAMQVIRRAVDDARRVLRANGHDDPGFGRTVHAGEDFVHLLTGFRNVDDAIRRYDLSEGDRIGHGIALGVDPANWARQVGRVAIPKEERLFDLAWEWSWYARRAGSVDVARIAFLEREVDRLSGECWGWRASPRDVEHLNDLLADEDALFQAGFPDGPRPHEATGDLEFLVHHLTDTHAFRQGRELVWVDPYKEIAALETVQRGLRQEVGLKGLIVEVNPTSNLLIGDLGDLAGHPLWRLRPPRPSEAGLDTEVSVCIGSDDPIVFNSHLPGEYQLLHDALLMSSLSDHEAEVWLDQTRADGMAARFTVASLPEGLRADPDGWLTGLRCPAPGLLARAL